MEFLFPADAGQWVSILRIGLGIQIVLYAISLKDDWNFLFAGPANGLAGREFSEALLARQSPFVPQLSWLIALGARAGLSEWTALSIAWCLLLWAGCGLAMGVFSRASAILAWLIHLCAASSGSLVSYGVDNFMTIGLFYLMLAPLPDRYAYENRWRRPRNQDPQLLGFWRRVLQIHLAFIYFFGGLAKALGSGWWNGNSLWRALIRSPFNLVPAETLVRFKYTFPIAGVAVCVLELGYAFAIWHKRTRVIWLTCILAMHIGIGLAMGMYLFAFIMIVLNAAAFAPELIFGRRKQTEVSATKLI
ncbi:MAG: HTTM domain-containing protein [Chthoniobacterales bacterium]